MKMELFFPGPGQSRGLRDGPDPDEFGRRVSKISVAQICEGIGFEAMKQSSLEALSQLVVQYISDLAKSATFNAHLAGRSECNVFDILKGLEDLNQNTNSSEMIVNQLSEFVEVMEIPFANPIPRFPVVSRRGKIQSPSFLQMGETPESKHIPDWLPAFPDPHTYINSPLWNQRKLDLRIDKGEQARQRRKAERSLLNLQQRLLSNALAGPSSAAVSGHDQPLALQANKGNKDFNHQRKQVSVKQMFAPAIEALKGGSTDADGDDGVSESEAMDIDRRVTPVSISVSNRRPVVHFKLKAGKKMLVEDLDVHLRSRLSEKRTSFLGRDDDKDDKKRRAELILRQSSMDNQQEVSQM
ncbi:Transcription initiation factor TFIID subunit 8 [Bienertia sinuspersici]